MRLSNLKQKDHICTRNILLIVQAVMVIFYTPLLEK